MDHLKEGSARQHECPQRSVEADVILNRASLALAKSERLIATWLPAQMPQKAVSSKMGDGLDEEDSKAFSSLPELYDALRYHSFPPYSLTYPDSVLELLLRRTERDLQLPRGISLPTWMANCEIDYWV